MSCAPITCVLLGPYCCPTMSSSLMPDCHAAPCTSITEAHCRHPQARELLELCASSHIAPPDGLRACISAINSDSRSPGAAADLLAKLMHMLAEVRVVAGKRGALIEQIGEVEEARREEGWLREYEGDEQRYKVGGVAVSVVVALCCAVKGKGDVASLRMRGKQNLLLCVWLFSRNTSARCSIAAYHAWQPCCVKPCVAGSDLSLPAPHVKAHSDIVNTS